MLPREEYVEQAHLFGILRERLPENVALQDLLPQLQYELLASTNLPMAVSFLSTELKHSGCMHPAMQRLSHYFEPFQAYVIAEAEAERGRFDMRIALQLLQAEALYRADHQDNRQGLFFFQFECLSRNRMQYDAGLEAMSRDSAYDQPWREWILRVRRDLGLVDLAELVFQQSQDYLDRRAEQRRIRGEPAAVDLPPPLFGKKEGRIALANRRKDALFLFAAMQRHLGYPRVPRPMPPDPAAELVPQLARRLERLEMRIKLMEDEQRQGIDITKFYQRPTAAQPLEPPEFDR
jgi:hypothetical protein